MFSVFYWARVQFIIIVTVLYVEFYVYSTLKGIYTLFSEAFSVYERSWSLFSFTHCKVFIWFINSDMSSKGGTSKANNLKYQRENTVQ